MLCSYIGLLRVNDIFLIAEETQNSHKNKTSWVFERFNKTTAHEK